MKIIARDVGVDAGMIILACMDYRKELKKYGVNNDKLKRLGKIFPIPNGTYKVRWEVIYPDGEEDNYEKLSGSGETIKVTSGKVLVCDPCYFIGCKEGELNRWGHWLNDTNYGDRVGSERAFLLSEIHDDGGYDIEFNFEKI
jgi:hypothetical protein